MKKIKTLVALTLAVLSFSSYAEKSSNNGSILAGYGILKGSDTELDGGLIIVNGTFNINDNIYGNFNGIKSSETKTYSLSEYQFGIGYKMPLNPTTDANIEISMSKFAIDIDGSNGGQEENIKPILIDSMPISLSVDTKLNENISITAGFVYINSFDLNLNNFFESDYDIDLEVKLSSYSPFFGVTYQIPITDLISAGVEIEYSEGMFTAGAGIVYKF